MGLMKEAFRRVRLMFAETKTNQAPFIRQSLKKKHETSFMSQFFSFYLSRIIGIINKGHRLC